jgi:phosphoribosyl 1,2-cyclic phosphodiesterase
MPDTGGMRLRFWGVRGSIASPGPDTCRFGGNTCCVELRCGPHLLLLDAGTGARPLGEALLRAGEPIAAEVLLSHTHLDHIGGLPFFAPIYARGAALRFWAGHLGGRAGVLEAALGASWSAPLLPDLRRQFRASLRFQDFVAGETLHPQSGLSIATAALQHPGGSVGYRVQWGGRAVAYVTDTEHQPGELDPAVLALARGADCLIYDSAYTDAEFPHHRGWGHSTWQQGVRLAAAAGAARVVLFHHEPGRRDDEMALIETSARAMHAGAMAAREGLELEF